MAEPVMLGMPHPPTAPRGVGQLRGPAEFPVAARRALGDAQLRANLGHATQTIRAKRAQVVAEVPGWEALREAGSQLKRHTMANLGSYLDELAQRVTDRGGTVHWARDAAEANGIVTALVQATGSESVVKVKSMATQEIGLNEHLAAAGIAAYETDLAELIVQLGDDLPSHILVPAIHRNRAEIREIFLREMADVDPDLTDEPSVLAAAARSHLRRKFLSARVAVSGANFGIAETGTLGVVESEGNGRMCLTLPETLITVMGIEKLVPRWRDLEVFLQLLPRSSTGERMNPYTSMWTGLTAGDGPREFHLVLLDNGRTAVLSDPQGRDALNCIRCSACLNVCPVYERVGGHAYGSVYPGPIGAVLSPQLTGVEDNASLPYASSLCGACYDVCPVKIDIPSMLVHLRNLQVEADRAGRTLPSAQDMIMKAASWVMRDERRWTAAVRGARTGRVLGRTRDAIGPVPLPVAGAWTQSRDLPRPPRQSFRDWWAGEHAGGGAPDEAGGPAPRRRRPKTRGAGAPESGATPPADKPRRSGDRGSRAEILDRIRRAHELAPPSAAPAAPAYEQIDRGYRDLAGRPPDDLVELLIDRLVDYRALVRRCREADLTATIAAAVGERGLRSVVVPAGLPGAWTADLPVRVSVDSPETSLSVTDLDAVGGVITGCAVAAAETGTLVLDAGDDQGRRAITLVPDYHLCVVPRDAIVADVPDLLARMDPHRPLTMISGPSATSDIELNRVEGVHGPRTLEVIVVIDSGMDDG